MSKIINKLVFGLIVLGFVGANLTINAKIVDDKLTINSFTQRLKQYHQFFNIQKITTKLSLNNQQNSKSKEDWQFALNSSYNYRQTDEIKSISTYDTNKSINVNSSLSRNFYDTGGNIKLDYGINKNSANNTLYGNKLSLLYSQPLLQNKDGINDILSYDLATIDVSINKFNILNNSQNFILTQLKLLVDLSFAQEQVRINNNRLLLVSKELELVLDKYKVSLLEKVDVLLQEDSLLRSKQQLLAAQQSLNLLQAKLAITLGITKKSVVSGLDLYKIHNLSTEIDDNFLINNNYELKILELEREKNNRSLLSNKNENNAKLDLVFGLGIESQQTSFGDNFSNYSPNSSIGLNLSYPLGGQANNAEFDRILLNLENIDYLYQNLLRNEQEAVNSLLVQLNSLVGILKTNTHQLVAAQKRTAEQQKRYKNGIGSITLVINAQDNEQNIRLSFAINAANYQKAFLDYLTIINKLQQ